MKDIETPADIDYMMRQFYSKLLELPDMQKVFNGIDMEMHMPHIVQFWSFVLLDIEGYKTNVFEKHLPLPIKSPQFDTWLSIFVANVDALFRGEKAELAKLRATSLAYTFKTKWQKLKE